MTDDCASERHPTPAAIQALAERFDLPNEDWMQDWEYMVADASRIDDFLSYAETRPAETEAVLLMQMIFQSFEDLGEAALHDPRWTRVTALLREQHDLHRCTIEYWASVGEPQENSWIIAPLARAALA